LFASTTANPARPARPKINTAAELSLLGQKKYVEAKPLPLQGYEVMKTREPKIPAHAKKAVADAGARIVERYDGWGKKDMADEWRKRLAPPTDTTKPKR